MTELRISKEELRALEPCNLSDGMEMFGEHEYTTPASNAKAGVSVSDFMGVLGCTGRGRIATKMAPYTPKRSPPLTRTPVFRRPFAQAGTLFAPRWIDIFNRAISGE